MSWFDSILTKRRISLDPGSSLSARSSIGSSHDGKEQLLDPDILGRIDSFELIAQRVVDGFMSGKHRSTHKGGSCEFSEHRPYSQGDETRLIDWRLFARRDRYYVKMFDDETNLHAWLVVDSSGSMGFSRSTVSKFDYGRRACACLGRLLLRQRDSIGLVCQVGGRQVHLHPRPQASHFQSICNTLRQATPGGSRPVTEVLRELPGVLKRRGMVVVFSDCFGDIDELASSLRILRIRGHDVIVFQVLAPEEQTFSFRGSVIFEDMEGLSPRLKINPSQVRRRYLDLFESFQETLRSELVQADCDLCTLTTNDDLGEALAHFLSYRAAKLRTRSKSPR